MLQPEKFEYAVPNLSYMCQDFKEKVFKKITASSTSLFLRGRDTINVTPSVTGRHEEDVEEVIAWAADAGQDNFLIDIGANVGLISCLCGSKFKQVFCYEPNPLAFKVLEVNTRIALTDASRLHLFNCAIGDGNTELELIIPKQNWGGAYIAQGNGYDQRTLLKKDGYTEFDADNYLKEIVTVKKAEDALGSIFKKLSNAGQNQGVIKIDAEGYEPTILKALARILPDSFKVVLIFENHLSQSSSTVLDLFKSRCRIFEIKSKKVRGATIVRLIKSLFGAKRRVMLEDPQGTMRKGNYALFVGV